MDSLGVFTKLDSLYQYQVPPVSSQPPSFALMMLQMIGMLVLISVVLYILLYSIKKINTKYKKRNEQFGFKLYENFYFSQKQGLSAVAFGKKLYIIGFSNNSVSVIDIIEDEEIISKLTVDKNEPNKFTDFLKNYFNKGK
jgi:flagellar biogenesis protein FliO